MQVNRQFSIVDADGHISESLSQLKDYIEAPYRDWSYRLGGSDGFDTRMGGILGTSAPDAASWSAALELGGMERAVLYPTSGLAFGLISDKDAAVAICRAYNKFFSDQFSGVDQRLFGVACLPLQDIDEAIAALRTAKEMGFVGGMLPAITRAPLLGDQRYFPLYEEAQRLNMMLAVHGATHGLDQVGADVYDRFIAVHTYTFPAAIMRQFTSVVYAGISEIYPRLRIGWMESGCTWLPFWLDRMDSEWRKRGVRETPALTVPPSQAVRAARWYFHAESEESLIPAAAQYLGSDKLFWASDWPHWDHEYPESLNEILNRDDLTETQKTSIMRENALRLYGMSES